MIWEDLIEPFWADQAEKVRGCFVNGTLRRDFLTYCDPASDWDDSLWARFGIVTPYFAHWPEEYADIAHLADVRLMSDPAFGGLTRWRKHDWFRLAAGDDVPLCPTVIRHARAMIWNLAAERIDVGALRSVAHWGGGCGLQTLILRWLGATHTEYIIDLPVMGDVQRKFLSANLGRRFVAQTHRLEKGKINCVPLSRVDEVPQGHDLFLALHSLNESTPLAQDYVIGRDWFDADRLVMEWAEGMDLFSGGDRWEKIAAGLVDDGRLLGREEMRCAMPPPLAYPRR